MLGMDFSIFANLFGDDATIVKSFIPLYSLEPGENSSEAWYSRVESTKGRLCELFEIMVVSFDLWRKRNPGAYEELLRAAFEGDVRFFVALREVWECWRRV